MSYHATGAEVIEWIGGIATQTTTPTKLRTAGKPCCDGGAQQDECCNPRTVRGRAILTARRRQFGLVGRSSLGACCSSCAQNALGATTSGATIISGAGGSTALRQQMSAGTVLTAPPPQFPPGFVPPGSGPSPIVKLLVLGGLGVGAFLIIKKLRGAKKAA